MEGVVDSFVEQVSVTMQKLSNSEFESMLFFRCPELRELINTFWDRDESGQGGLEIRLSVSGDVMASLCRYVHSGVYVVLI